MLVHNQWFQRLTAGFVERTSINVLSGLQLFFMGRHKDPQTIKMIRRVRRQRQSLLSAYESFIVYSLARAFRKRPGEMAEVGVFRGGSARLICEAKGDKPLHLFDTFAGLPAATAPDGKVHHVRQMACSLAAVREFVQGFPNVHFHPGLFPETAAPLSGSRFCFVHCDVDLYQSTLACLEFFYPRIHPGGVLISHDYSILAGVRKAFQEFFADKPDAVVELPSTQCMFIKA